jgi:hypothetical protein
MNEFEESDKKPKDKQLLFYTMNVDEKTGKFTNAVDFDESNIAYPHFYEIAKRFSKGLNGYSISND